MLPGLRDQDRESAAVPSKVPFNRRFEDAVGEACESAAARPVAWRFGLSVDTRKWLMKEMSTKGSGHRCW
jgi:hypothetical protein